MFSNPKLMKLVTEGVRGTSTQNIQGYTRFMNQLGSGLVGNNIITEEQNSMVQNTIKANQDQLEDILKGNLKAVNVVPNEMENPANAEAIQIQSNQPPPSSDTMTAMQLPTVTPANLPITQGTDNRQQNIQLASALNLFNKGGNSKCQENNLIKIPLLIKESMTMRSYVELCKKKLTKKLMTYTKTFIDLKRL